MDHSSFHSAVLRKLITNETAQKFAPWETTMGKRYSSSLSAQTNTGSKTLQETVGATTTRFQVYDLIVSAGGVAPADNAAEYQLKRFTAAGTVTSFTPVAIDPGDPATLLTLTTAGCGFSASGEPTYTAGAIMLDIGVNMRATFRWVARERSEIIAPASTNGLGLFVNAVNSAFASNVTQLHEEWDIRRMLQNLRSVGGGIGAV